MSKLNWLQLDISKHLVGCVGKGLRLHKQGLAQVMPFILEEEFPDLHILHLDKGNVVLCDQGDFRWKVCCSSSKSFDLAPSFTKGASRSKDGLTIGEYLDNLCDGVILVNFQDPNNIKVSMVNLSNLDVREDGVVIHE